jgi:hypothetical protein
MMSARGEDNARIAATTPAPGAGADVYRRRFASFLALVLGFGGLALLRYGAEAQRLSIIAQHEKRQALILTLWRFADQPATTLQASLAPGQSISPRWRYNNRRSEANVPGIAFDERYRDWSVVVQFSGQPDDPLNAAYIVGWRVVGPNPPRESTTSLWWAVEYARLTIIGLSPIAWLACAALALSVGGLGQRVWPICLISGLACTMAAAMVLGFDREQAVKPLMSWFHAGVAMVLLSAPLPLIRRRRAAITGHCEQCGYDLTGNQSGICPECGTPTPLGVRRQRLDAVSDIANQLDHVIVPPLDEDSETDATMIAACCPE